MTYGRSLTTLAFSLALTIVMPAFAQTTTIPEANSSTERVAPRPNDKASIIVQSRARSQAQDDERARGLIRIGEEAIARENDAALDAYFADDFVFHGPGGDLNYAQLKANFAAMRAAFSGFAVTRQAILVKGDMVAARTTMTGTFTAPFAVAPYGTLTPTGRPMRLELINLFRYNAAGELAEEWVQSDSLEFLQQLGLEMQPVH